MRKYKYQEVKNKIEAFDHKLLSTQYMTCKEKLQMQCINGHIFERSFDSFINGHPDCPYCKLKGYKRDTYQFKQEVKELTNDEYEVLGDYAGTEVKIKMKHNICGKTFNILPRAFLSNGTRCCYCFGKNLKTTEQFKHDVHDLVGNEYEVLGDYINSNTHILMKHNKCGHEWLITPGNFLYGFGCPKCKQSKGEIQICNFLKDNGFTYDIQYTFNDCKNITYLKFDVAVFDDKYNNIKYLIEYQGQQHYEPIEWFGGLESFNKQQKRDNIKKQYCLDNNIALLVIPYWDFNNIDVILSDKLIA